MIKIGLLVLVDVRERNVDNIMMRYSDLEIKTGKNHPKTFKLLEIYIANEFNCL